jgi:hypothetical protein
VRSPQCTGNRWRSGVVLATVTGERDVERATGPSRAWEGDVRGDPEARRPAAAPADVSSRQGRMVLSVTPVLPRLRARSPRTLLVVLALLASPPAATAPRPATATTPPLPTPPPRARSPRATPPKAASSSSRRAPTTSRTRSSFTEAAGVTVAYEGTTRSSRSPSPASRRRSARARPVRHAGTGARRRPRRRLGRRGAGQLAVTLTTTNLPHFDELGAVDVLEGVGTGAFVSTPSVLRARRGRRAARLRRRRGPARRRAASSGPDPTCWSWTASARRSSTRSAASARPASRSCSTPTSTSGRCSAAPSG